MERVHVQTGINRDPYRDLFATSPDPIFIEGEDGTVLDANEAACRFQGMSRDALIGSNVLDLVPEPLKDRVGSDFRKWISGELTTYRGYSRKPDGTDVPVEIHGVRIRYHDQPAVILHVRDVSDQARLEDAFAQVFQEMLSGFALHEILTDDRGIPVDYRYLAVNPAFERAVGKSADQLVGKRVLEVFPDLEPHWIEVFGQVALTGKPVHLEDYTRVVDKHFDITAFSPQPGRFAVVIYDVTRQNKALEEVRRRDAYSRALLKAIPETLLVVDREGRYDGARGRLAGEEAASGAGLRPLADYGLAEEVCRQWREAIGSCLATGSVARLTYERKDLFGPSWWEAVFSPLSRDEALVVCRDITERVRQDERDKERERKVLAAQKLESLGVLAGGIAHDFNNLLVGVMGNADLALMSVDEQDPIRPCLEDLKQASVRASELTHLMLAYSGRGTFSRHALDLNALVRETCRLVSPMLSARVDVRFDLEDELPMVHGDAAQLRQVLMNLLTNASDAMQGEAGVLTLRTRSGDREELAFKPVLSMPTLAPGRYAVIEVADTGSGIPEEDQARIFEPFYTTKFTGRGLGLAAALGILRGHQGGIELQSRRGSGTTFRLAVPVNVRQEGSTEMERREEPNRGGDAAKINARILVVDDESSVRRVIQRVLGRIGCEVIEAENGAAALEALSRQGNGIRAMLLDLTMPVMDGEATLHALRERGMSLPVLLMSGFSESEAQQKFADYPVDGFVEKPFEIETLRGKVQGLLGT